MIFFIGYSQDTLCGINDCQLFIFRLKSIGIASWSSSSFLERQYSNMVYSATDSNVSNLDSIPPHGYLAALKNYNELLIEDFNLNYIDIASIITLFFNTMNNFFLQQYKGKMMHFFMVITPNDHLSKLNANLEKIYTAIYILEGKVLPIINFEEKLTLFLKRFSLRPQDIQAGINLFSQKKIPFFMEFHKSNYYFSSVQFLSAFGELLYRYGHKSGNFTRFKGKKFETDIANIVLEFTPKVITRIKLPNENIGNKYGTDIDVAILFEDVLFLLECKAYSRINYHKRLNIEEIEGNCADIEEILVDNDELAKWATIPEKLSVIIEKMNNSLPRVQKIQAGDIQYIFSCVITIAPEFLLNVEKLGWISHELKIPRCCTMREIRKFFKEMKNDEKIYEKLLKNPKIYKISK